MKIKDYRHYDTTVKSIDRITEGEISRSGVTKDEFEKLKKALKTVIELRHTLQHSGIPNILREVSFKEIGEEDIAKMIVPQNYKETKEIFSDANKLLELLPKPTIHAYPDGHAALIGSSKIKGNKRASPEKQTK